MVALPRLGHRDHQLLVEVVPEPVGAGGVSFGSHRPAGLGDLVAFGNALVGAAIRQQDDALQPGFSRHAG